MSRSGVPRWLVAGNLVFAGLLGWLYGGDVATALAARAAEVAALPADPPVVFPLIALALTVAAGLFTVAGALTKRGGSWRGYQALPVVAVVLVLLDFGVLSAVRVGESSEELALVAVQQFTDFAAAAAREGQVVVDAQVLEPGLQRLGPVPYLVGGARPQRWTLAVRRGCTGPASATEGQPVGALLYCVAPDRSRAYVTVVGLPLGARRGVASVVSTDAAWVGTVLAAPVKAEPPVSDDDDGDRLPTP